MSKLIQKRNYWYLHYSFKLEGKTKTYEKYLGTSIPKNILIVKNQFDEEVFRKRFSKELQKIFNLFSKEIKLMNNVAIKKYYSQFAIKFTYNSQAIEGSTLNLKDTALLIEHGIAPNKKQIDIELSKTHYEVFIEILNNEKDITVNLMLYWHKKLFERTYPEMAGEFRKHTVRVMGSKSKFTEPKNIKKELKEFITWFRKNEDTIHPIRLAALAHLKFVSIHPFTDGNGRVSRLLMNYILYKNKFPLLDIDYLKRKQYYNSLEKDQVNGTEVNFVNYLTKKYLKDHN